LYKEQDGQWLTPVELFRPHYSYILANFVAEMTSASDRVHIVELGGGLGTNANLILSQLQRTKPKLYDQVSYTIIDSSQPLMEL
jgi:SAM-dependent MidA family methyltransferase